MNLDSVNVSVVGSSGRVGRALLECIDRVESFVLSAAVNSKNMAELDRAVLMAQVVIDFSVPEVTEQVLLSCIKHKRALIIGTTGHSAEQQSAIESAAKTIPVVLAPNTSLGVAVMGRLIAEAHRLLGANYDIEISEMHRATKRDAPSGTALHLAQLLKPNSINAGRGKTEQSKERPAAEIGISSIRGGDVFGEHTVYFLGAGERIEITHRIASRETFALGALNLAQKLLNLKAGRLYYPQELL